uniref:Transposase n=1 Tax=Steinernema glaseri TaxID=37863 RepID=A0A1I8AVL7_9BILA
MTLGNGALAYYAPYRTVPLLKRKYRNSQGLLEPLAENDSIPLKNPKKRTPNRGITLIERIVLGAPLAEWLAPQANTTELRGRRVRSPPEDFKDSIYVYYTQS